jgi:hypothetical protein
MESVKKTMLTAPVRMMNNKDTVTFDTEVNNSKFVCFEKLILYLILHVTMLNKTRYMA